ncbi:hypothetical protein SAY87_003082 [Trapa incisa]|uniref:Uncharacterized protein n=1 Tax=Trapa incisa TaxID=236973 RepID=A0AAN7QH72_9MYRT|nr:hypothetical protein SAY87_003082 [Trapa incisa]
MAVGGASMVSSMAALARRLPLSLRPATKVPNLSVPFCTKGSSVQIPTTDESSPESTLSQSSSQDLVGQRDNYGAGRAATGTKDFKEWDTSYSVIGRHWGHPQRQKATAK